MGILSEATEIPRKTMIMFFLIDTSGSMDGDKIASLNDAMREMLPDIQDIPSSNADALIKLAVLDFASGTEWITPLPQDLDTFRWQDLEAGGTTDMGEACRELNAKLDCASFLQDKVGNFAPVIILMSDGAPTDDFKSGLAALKQNKWFGAAIKIAFSIGQDADDDVLADFTGNKELVIPIMGKAMMKRMIRFVSVTSSKIGSAKAGDGTGHEAKQRQVAEQIQAEMQELDPEENIDEGW
ncbi:MAG: vWA domain-containing protein [Treponema sp.]